MRSFEHLTMINFKKLATTSEYECRDLTRPELEKLLSIYFSLVSSNRGQNKIIYRGVDYDFLADRLSKKNESPTDTELAKRLFYFGEKAQYFRNENIDRKWLVDIADNTNETSNKIFDRLFNLKTSSDVNIKKFISSNPDFFNFFNNKSNKLLFSKMNTSIGIDARDYFWSILHTSGYIGTSGFSFSTSTSTSFKQAVKFSNKKNERRYVIFSINRIGFRKRNQLLQKISSYGVPTLSPSSSIHRAQKEETLKAGLFPHDIIGLYCLHERKLIINPHIFSEPNSNKNIAIEPLSINQERFDENLKELTSYSSWFYTFDRQEYFQVHAAAQNLGTDEK